MRVEELAGTNSPIPQDEERNQAEGCWLVKNRANYAGQWVALDGDRLLAHGADAALVYQTSRAALAHTGRVPLVVLIETADELPFGGW
jgi:hypothetical protein